MEVTWPWGWSSGPTSSSLEGGGQLKATSMKKRGRTFLPKCNPRSSLWDPQPRTTTKATSGHGRDLFSWQSSIQPGPKKRSTRTVSHRVVFWEVLEIACLHSKQVVNLSSCFSRRREKVGQEIILLSDGCSWTWWQDVQNLMYYPSSDHSIDHSMSKCVEVESAKDGHYVWIYDI